MKYYFQLSTFKHTLIIIISGLLFSFPTGIWAQKKFTVVIDAGHGGKDSGARGKTYYEKDINLAMALNVGDKIEKENPDVNVLYTRKTDVYLTVAERPKFANDMHADLFISIHVNSSKNKEAVGYETYTLGVAKTQENLEVAMFENSVILLEDDYRQKYQGFNPKSVESYIMFEFMQDKYMEQSIILASAVQKHLGNHCSSRKSRGVRQAGFLVLKNTAMPSILIELGFISNAEEEKYLHSEIGQNELSSAIYKAFLDFKHEFDKKTNSTATENVMLKDSSKNQTIANNEIPQNEPTTYKVQIYMSKKRLKANDPVFNGLKDIDYYLENDTYKYTYGSTTDYTEILKKQKEARQHFPKAFVVSFVGEKRVK